MLSADPGKGTEAIETYPTPSFALVTGEVLRQVRVGRSLSLRQVTVRSGGRFKPSSVASYERGERQISLERLFALADVYDVSPERIVAAITHRLEHGGAEGDTPPEPVLVIDRLDLRSRTR
jgi:transcriptional regulator with XRE-family HTH domain